jgi:hypothetical protein
MPNEHDITAELRAVREEKARRESPVYTEVQRAIGRFPWLRFLSASQLEQHEERLARDYADLRKESFRSANADGSSLDGLGCSYGYEQTRLTEFASME